MLFYVFMILQFFIQFWLSSTGNYSESISKWDTYLDYTPTKTETIDLPILVALSLSPSGEYNDIVLGRPWRPKRHLIPGGFVLSLVWPGH